MPRTYHTPKAYAKDAVLRLGILISQFKQSLDESELEQLRTWYKLARDCNDKNTLHKMVSYLNNRRYKTRSSFQILSCYSEEHGHNTLEIREDRF